PDLEEIEGVTFLKKSLQAQGLKPPEAELRAAVERCKRHPLSLRLLAALLKEYTNLDLNTLLYDPLYAEYWKGAIASRLLDLIYRQQLDQTQRHLLLAFSVFRTPALLQAAAAIMEVFAGETITTGRLLPVVAVLRNLHLLEDAPVLRHYQLHPIVASYARDRFDEQGNGVTLLDAHVKAAEFYQRQAEKTGSSSESRQYLLEFVEAAWHWCQAKRQQTAYDLICQKALFANLQRYGDNATLFKLYGELFPLEAWQPQPLQAAQIHNEYGEIQSALGQKREAQSSFKQALAGFQQIEDVEGQIKTLNNLGAVYRNLSKLENALSCYQEALRICNAMESPYLHGKAASLNNIGVISLYLGQIEHALELFEQALPLQQAIQDRSEEARTLMNIGRVYDIQKRSDDAYQRYQQALRIFQETGDREGQAAVYNKLGIYYTKKPEKTPEKKRILRQEAEKQHMSALRIFQEIGDREQEAITLQRLGRLSFYSYAIDRDSRASEDFEKPLAFYLHSRQICQELRMPEKGEIPRLVIDELQSRLGAEQLATLIAEIEPRALHIVEQVLRRGYALNYVASDD
ncbi:MAG TPA: tetratricopeptide repeat protein, partial [Ktedonobacteraceae bacterium]|nr:tetratricopeptide repeat protein [Ktedonobacteraceae bacterium]